MEVEGKDFNADKVKPYESVWQKMEKINIHPKILAPAVICNIRAEYLLPPSVSSFCKTKPQRNVFYISFMLSCILFSSVKYFPCVINMIKL